MGVKMVLGWFWKFISDLFKWKEKDFNPDFLILRQIKHNIKECRSRVSGRFIDAFTNLYSDINEFVNDSK